MNTVDVLKYGHATVQQTVQNLPDATWEMPGACGVWSIKNLIAHLASFELVLVDVLKGMVTSEAHISTPSATTPYLNKFTEANAQFNDSEVDARKEKTAMETLAEYDDAHSQVMSLIVQIPEETQRQPGTLPWYGTAYALDDYIVYAFYGHKREHCGQIAIFRDKV